MRKKHLFIYAMAFAIATGCSKKEKLDEDIPKKLIKTERISTQNNYSSVSNLSYDSKDNIVEVTDNNNNVTEKFTYNASNQLSSYELRTYNNNNIQAFHQKSLLSYNENNKISKLVETITYYDDLGNMTSEKSKTSTVVYTDNSFTKTVDINSNLKVEYFLTNDLITGIKIYENDMLDSNLTFEYDADGNCISGKGKINNSFPTENINLNVTYGSVEKHPVFNQHFDFNVLQHSSYESLKNVIVDLQGTKYVVNINDYRGYDETRKYTFDNQGYISTMTTEYLPEAPDAGVTKYLWVEK